jgi:sporulation protein YlmC with PRC-barrel domain
MDTLNKENLTGTNREAGNPNMPLRFLTASSVIGDKVINSAGEDLGTIKDIMLDVKNGSIEYMVIQFGGFLGIGEKYFAIPYEQLHVDPANHAFRLNQSKDVLEKAPGFNKEHWPETNVHAFSSSEKYWGGFMGPNVGGGVS